MKDKESVLPVKHYRLRETTKTLVMLYTQWGKRPALLKEWETRLAEFDQAAPEESSALEPD